MTKTKYKAVSIISQNLHNKEGKVQARSLLIDEYVVNSSSGDENKVLTILKRLWAVC
jgi:hypothetical protein